jgi:hypothetical protein
MPKAEDPTVRFGGENCGWLRALNWLGAKFQHGTFQEDWERELFE